MLPPTVKVHIFLIWMFKVLQLVPTYIYIAGFFANKRAQVLKLLSRLEDVSAIDPQVGINLLRLCSSYCRMGHLARLTPLSLSSDPLKMLDNDVRDCFSNCLSLVLSESAYMTSV